MAYQAGYDCASSYGRIVVVDAKVSLEAYMDAISASDENLRMESLRRHARQINEHIKGLSKKAYWDQIRDEFQKVVIEDFERLTKEYQSYL
jgi:DNA anti-recombination protein RmuC